MKKKASTSKSDRSSPAAKQPATKQPPAAKKPAAKKPVAKKPAASKLVAKRPAAKQPAAKKLAAKKPGARADYGAPIDGFFAKQPAQFRPLLVELRKLIEEVAPDVTASIKWGMPCFALDDAMMCALGGHKSHVNLILSGPPGTFSDPKGRLSGEAKTGRHLKLTSLDDLPRAEVRGWLRAAAKVARAR